MAQIINIVVQKWYVESPLIIMHLRRAFMDSNKVKVRGE